MNILGIDYGEKKIGLAVGDTDSKFAEPLMVVRYDKEEKAFRASEEGKKGDAGAREGENTSSCLP